MSFLGSARKGTLVLGLVLSTFAAAELSEEASVPPSPDASTSAAVEQANAISRFDANRDAFENAKVGLREELGRLDQQVASLDREIKQLEAQIVTASQRRPSVPPANPVTQQAEDPLAGLRIAAGIVESMVFSVFYPAVSYTEKIFSGLGWAGVGAAKTASGALNVAMSIFLVLTFGLALLFLKKYHADYFEKHRKILLKIGIVVLVVLPISAFAEPTEDRPLADLLVDADQILAKTWLQRSVLDLESLEGSGRSYAIRNIPLSGLALPAFSSFTIDTAEYHVTLATLYYTDQRPEQALERLTELANPDVAYTKQSNADVIVEGATVHLLDKGQSDLAAKLIEVRAKHLANPSTIRRLYQAFRQRSLSVSAGLLANRAIDVSKNTQELYDLAAFFYAEKDALAGQDALRRALKEARSPTDLKNVMSLAIAQQESDLILDVIAQSEKYFSDVEQYFDMARMLQASGRPEESKKVLELLIDKTDKSRSIDLRGKRVDRVAALSYISSTCFEEGRLDLARSSGVLLIRSLSPSQRSQFIMSLPAAQQQAFGLPDPQRLTAPLYFGILDEVMASPDKAGRLYERETIDLLNQLLQSNGLQVPEMLNHLTLLGRSLKEQGKLEELVLVDSVMQKLEETALSDLRAGLAPAFQAKQSLVQQRTEQIAGLKARLAALEASRTVVPVPAPAESDQPGAISVMFSGLFLPLRIVVLLGVLTIIFVGITAIAWRFSQKLCAQRFYGFTAKFAENLGWVYIFTVVTAPVGIAMVLASQWAQLAFSVDGSRCLVNEARKDVA